jgi:membrane protease YdiL (CAAX protease family)
MHKEDRAVVMTAQQFRLSAAVILGLISAAILTRVLREAGILELLVPVAALRGAAAYGIDLLVLVALVLGIGRVSLTELGRCIGLVWPPHRSSGMIAALFIPAGIVAYVVTGLSSEAGSPEFAGDMLFLAVVAPLFEEVLFRGLALGVLVRLAGWQFLPAVLLQAVIFGLAHMFNGSAPGEIAGIVAITGLGGLVFGWLYVRCGYDLWPALALHVGLNGLWGLFALGENAIGGALGNGLRIAIVLAALAAVWWTTRATPPDRTSQAASRNASDGSIRPS